MAASNVVKMKNSAENDPFFSNRIEYADRTPCPVHKSKFLGRGQLRIYICGASGCGKSTVLRSIVPNIADTTGAMFLLTTALQNQVHEEIERYARETRGIEFEKYSDPEQARDEIFNYLQEKPLDEHVLIIVDDFLSAKANPLSDRRNLLTIDLTSWIRGYNASIVVIAQNYVSLTPATRVSINSRYIFRAENDMAPRMISRDVEPIFAGSGMTFMDAYAKYVSGREHNYLVCNGSPRRAWAITFDEKRGKPTCHDLVSDATREKTVDGEIRAGNTSDATKLMKLALSMSRCKNDAMYDRLACMFERQATKVPDHIVKQIAQKYAIELATA